MLVALQDSALPALREDLQLVEGPSELNGSPTWTIFDPVRNRFFRIGWAAFQLLSRWPVGKADLLVKAVSENTTCQISHTDVASMTKFLHANSLTKDSATGTSEAYLAQYQASRPHWLKWLIHNYLFVRIPLIRPHRFLIRTLPLVEPLFSYAARILVVMSGMLGLYLVSRQWESFVSTFLHFFSLQGAALYALALPAIKVLHELGHAYTATRFGSRVSTMGVALLVMFPVLYTDTTDAWRLRSEKERLLIGGAGMITEAGLAAIAILLWSFLPDGAWRSACFIVATSSLIVTLAINLNPLMRFDGYYILSDLLGVHNLQERSFALAKWKLRDILFGLKEPPPERLPPALHAKLTLYACATWIYRFFLFLGIALLVYHYFFKALGIILFTVEIVWFILLPVFREMMVWWGMRDSAFKTRRFLVTALLLAGLVVLTLMPWSSRVSFPAILQAAHYATVYAPEPGRIKDVRVQPKQPVKAGDVLVTLESPPLEDEILRTGRKVQVHRLRFERLASNPEDLANMRVALQQWTTESSRLSGLQEKRMNLVIRAPIAGVVTDVADALHMGRWVNQKLALAFIVQPSVTQLDGLIHEQHLARLTIGQPARFFPEDPMLSPVDASVAEIALADKSKLDMPYLASIYGGEIAARRDEQGEITPESSVYQIKLTVPELVQLDHVVRGSVHVDGQQQSFAKRLYNSVASVLIRESGF